MIQRWYFAGSGGDAHGTWSPQKCLRQRGQIVEIDADGDACGVFFVFVGSKGEIDYCM